MKPYIERMIMEKYDLEVKVTKAKQFLGSEASKDIVPEERHLLERQIHHYSEVITILGRRIELAQSRESK